MWQGEFVWNGSCWVLSPDLKHYSWSLSGQVNPDDLEKEVKEILEKPVWKVTCHSITWTLCEWITSTFLVLKVVVAGFSGKFWGISERVSWECLWHCWLRNWRGSFFIINLYCHHVGLCCQLTQDVQFYIALAFFVNVLSSKRLLRNHDDRPLSMDMILLQITHLTPEGVADSITTSFTGLFEVGAERVCTFTCMSNEIWCIL